MIKRFLSGALITIIFAGLFPFSVSASHETTSLVTITGLSTGTSVNLNYSVLGPSPAQNLKVDVYLSSPSTLLGSDCNIISTNWIARVQEPLTIGVGNYTAQWTGVLSNGTLANPAYSYCFQITWSNPPLGSGYPTKFFTLPAPAGTTGGTAGTGGYGTGATSGTGTGAVPTGPACHETADFRLCAEPTEILEKGGGYVEFDYTIKKNLSRGFSLRVYDSASIEVKDVRTAIGGVTQNFTETRTWNGTRNNGRSYVAPGRYSYKFKMDGKEEAVGTINVVSRSVVTPPSTTTPPTSCFVFSVDNPVIYRGSNPSYPSTATVQPTVLCDAATGLVVKIVDSLNNPIRELYQNAGTVYMAAPPGPLPWNGKNTAGNSVDVGTYWYVAYSGNGVTELTRGAIEVRDPPISSLPLDVSYVSVSPMSFNPDAGQSAQVSFTINKAANVTINALRADGTAAPQNIINNQPYNAGNFSVTWYGQVSAGTYNIRVDANSSAYESDFGQVFGVIVNRSPVASLQITNVALTKTRFNPDISESTQLTFNLSHGAYVTVAVYPTVGLTTAPVATLINNQFYNQGPISPPIPWNGLVNAGTYDILINATSSAYGSDSEIIRVMVDRNTNVLAIDSVSVTNLAFNPDLGGDTNLSFRLNYGANVTVTVFKDNVDIYSLLPSPQFYPGNTIISPPIRWTGINRSGQYVTQGVYKLQINASSSTYGPATASIDVTVNRGTTNVLSITSMALTRPSINPDLSTTSERTTDLTFYLNNPANVTVSVLRPSPDLSVLRTLVPATYYNSGTSAPIPWDGKDSSGQPVLAGVYKLKVEGTSTIYGNDVETIDVTVNRGTANVLNISNLAVTRYAINTDLGERTDLTFYLNNPANVTVSVLRPDLSVLRTLVPSTSYNQGTNYPPIQWDGKDGSGQPPTVGGLIYKLKVEGISSIYGNDVEYIDVRVDRSTTTVLQILGGDYPSRSPFDPRTQDTYIDFATTVAPTTLFVRVYRQSTFIRELPLTNLTGTNAYRATWNGKDQYNATVSNDTYAYRIEATYLGQAAQKSGSVVVRQDGVVTGQCANFTDVSTSHYLCPAVEFVKSRGMFHGYNDGSIGLDRVIQRAELLAVMQKAFRFTLDDYSPSRDGSLGFSDLKDRKNDWYMPYIKTFKRLELVVGYPDRKFRPERTMNTAELYLVFLKSAKRAGDDVAKFVISSKVKAAPFIDTPLSHKWYIKYASFAQLNDLVTTERFYPGRGITRGQVIKLIYDTHVKGLIKYGPAR